MSRSRKDGRHGGGHRGIGIDREYWSARYRKIRMPCWGTLKPEMHREERRRNKAEARGQLGEVHESA